jgi:LacI family transcriptional regulator
MARKAPISPDFDASGGDDSPLVRLRLATDIGYGRELAVGIATYTRTHRRWRFLQWSQAGGLGIPFEEELDRGAGLIAHVTDPAMIREIRHSGIPAVNISGRLETLQFPSVLPDDRAIGAMAGQHFMERGYRHFAYVGIGEYAFSNRRGDAFVSTVRTADNVSHVARHDIHFGPNWTVDRQQEQMKAWIRSLPVPVAVFTANDRLASYVLDACRQCDLRVPEDVAVLGVDNDVVLCEFNNPPISSIDPNIQQIG